MCHGKTSWLRFGLVLVALLLIGRDSTVVATGHLSALSFTWSDATPTVAPGLPPRAPTAGPAAGGFTGAAGSKNPVPADTSTPQPRDSDADQVLDWEDNCPLSPNLDQVDSNDNGLGDPCDAPFTGGFAFVTPTGVVQSRVDERLRPIEIAAPEALLTFVWSDDASQVEITAQADGESSTYPLAIDLSDAALLQALDAVEVETGRTLTGFRAWIADNPGRVLAVARGEEPSPLQPADLSLSTQRAPGLASIILPQPEAQKTATEQYLERIGSDAAVALEVWHSHVRARGTLEVPGTLRWITLEREYWDFAMRLLDHFEREMVACLPCSAACSVPCNRKGACLTNPPDPLPCESLFESECEAIGGVFFEGSDCGGACWAFSNGTSGCFGANKEECLRIPELSRASGGQGNITTRFCPAKSCDDPVCEP